MKVTLTNNKVVKDAGRGKDKNPVAEEPRNKKIISVISNKGGVGKTSVACCLALSLSRELNKKTLLMELDCSPGDFGTLFDIGEDKSLEMAIRFRKDYKKYVKCTGKNLDILKGIPDPIIAENISSQEINDFLDIILGDYEYIIVDTHTVLNGILLDLIKASKILLMISDPTMESIARVSNYLQLLSSRFKVNRNKFKFIINMKNVFSFFRTWEIAKMIDFPIDSFIHFDRKFSKTNILFNESKILRTVFFKQVSKSVKSIDPEITDVKR
jgi:MinD-like ATPase involved in chromosome partitioning or flagellar assembly